MHTPKQHIEQVFRHEYGRVLAGLVRLSGDIDTAQDALQEAFTIALRKWPTTGTPPNPGAWITTTARHVMIDKRRRQQRGEELLRQWAPPEPLEMSQEEPSPDDPLRLIFTCCHPALSMEAHVALTLRLLGGLTTQEIAQAFLVQKTTMAQRIVRAKMKIKAAHIPYRVPEAPELPARLHSVLLVLYLIYNAHPELQTNTATPTNLRTEAIKLARMLATLLPQQQETQGLLALLLLVESRQSARLAPNGDLVLLRDQDRASWDQALIQEGQTLVRWCLQQNKPGPYQIQAAIQAVHSDAPTFADTEWSQIITLYDHLMEWTPTPVVALNRAIAWAEVHGPQSALTQIESLPLESYYAYHAARAEMLLRLGQTAQAKQAYQRAATLAPTQAEQNYLKQQAMERPAQTPS